MNYKIILNNAKADFEECSISEVYVSDEYDFSFRSAIINLALNAGEMNYEDIDLVERVYKKEDAETKWQEVPTLPKEKYGVHQTHCCSIHGCKYGDYECPVEKGIIKQDYPCESCSEGDKHTLFGKGDGIDGEYLFYD